MASVNVPAYLIDATGARELVRAGSVRAAEAFPSEGGWSLAFHTGLERRVLRTAGRSGDQRVFRKIETLAGYARGLGLARLELNMERWEASPQTLLT